MVAWRCQRCSAPSSKSTGAGKQPPPKPGKAESAAAANSFAQSIGACWARALGVTIQTF
jgi:hypothetical protein